MPPWLLYFEVIGDPLKKVSRPIVVRNKRVLDIIPIKLRHLKGKNGIALKDSISNGLDIKGLKPAQRNELIVPG